MISIIVIMIFTFGLGWFCGTVQNQRMWKKMLKEDIDKLRVEYKSRQREVHRGKTIKT